MKATKKEMFARVQQLADKNGGDISHDMLLSDARNKKSPLHAYYEWNAKRGLEQWQLSQTRRLMRDYKIEYKINTIICEVPAFVHDERTRDHGYRDVREVQTDELHARRTIVREVSSVVAALRRAQQQTY